MMYGDVEGCHIHVLGRRMAAASQDMQPLEIVLRSRRVQSFRPAHKEKLGRLLHSVAPTSASSSTKNLPYHTSAYVVDYMVRAIAGTSSNSQTRT